ncbi:FAD-dependent monooxygenase [Patulibacter defluvii]|uniref:FAD-dependent monooxygenase n=1 Tax=Patulibacter defluvii TaxID=3095358 RepID=UPI002A752CFC|nr:FAD-dependent monooxygenase [Patulibacter sp. DM4]
MSDERPVAIAGAGIAGLTLAAALQRAGRPVVVLERRPATVPAGGSGLSIWPNALAALDRIGLGDAVRTAGRRAVPAGTRTPDGRWLQRPGRERLREALGEELVGIRRTALLEALAGGLDAGVVRAGRAVEGFEPLADRVVLRLDGGERLEASVLVGADGIASPVARALDPRLRPRPAGYLGWRGIAPLATGEDPCQFWGPAREAGLMPVGPRETYWFTTERAGPDARRPPDPHAHLAHRFADWDPELLALIAATPEHELLWHPIEDRRMPRRWSRGRVVAIGDAAHPTRPHLGQGGAQAIEDGVLLGGLLAAGGDPTVAFARFERLRRPRVRRIVVVSSLLGRALHSPAPIGVPFRIGARVSPDAMMLAQLRPVASRAAFERHAARVLSAAPR